MKKKKFLQSDCPTRWSSTAKMLKKAASFKPVVELMYLRGDVEAKEFVPRWDAASWKYVGNLNNLMLPTIYGIDLLEGMF